MKSMPTNQKDLGSKDLKKKISTVTALQARGIVVGLPISVR
jgi:hypothetical protein